MTAIKKENKIAPIVSRGFRGRRAADVDPARVPPGQYVTADFPVLSAGPTPHTSLELWDCAEPPVLALPAGRIFPPLAGSAVLDHRRWCGSGDFSAVWVILGLSLGSGGGRAGRSGGGRADVSADLAGGLSG